MVAGDQTRSANKTCYQKSDAQGPCHQHAIAVHDDQKDPDHATAAHCVHTYLKIDITQQPGNGGKENACHEGGQYRV